MNIKLKRSCRKIRSRARILQNNTTSGRMRLSYCKSNKFLSLQIIGKNGETIMSASTHNIKLFPNLRSRSNSEAAAELGKMMISLMKTKGIDYSTQKFFFDKGRFKYHGVVKKSVETLRNNGLII